MKINAIVLAAGYGSRLAPLTEEVPKPVLPLAGVPMLTRILRKLKDAGIERIAVNMHHLPDAVRKCVDSSGCADSVTLFHEPEIFGTGGPLVNAKELLSEGDCFILHNSDVSCNFDLGAMIRQHRETGALVTMAAIEGPENRLHVEQGIVADILDRLEVPYSEHAQKRTYACVSVYSPRFFRYLPEKPCNASLVDAWLRAIQAGEIIRAYFPDPSCYWNDIGSFAQYFEANAGLMRENPIDAAPGSSIAEDARLSGFVSIGEGVEIPSGTSLCNCIVLPDSKVKPGYHAWEVITPSRTVHRDHRKIAALDFMKKKPEGWRIQSLPEQGSDRKFIRVIDADSSTQILMLSNGKDKDFDRFISLGSCFNKHDLFTPQIYAVQKDEYAVLMEDLGDSTLFNLAAGREKESYELYRRTVYALAEFQVKGTSVLDSENQEIRVFSRRYLRWETDYFKSSFLNELCEIHLTPNEEENLKHEFDSLALAAEKMPYLLIHRDFQSQNILCQNGKIRFVDYQGARLAPYSYDISSLIRDPYVRIPDDMKESLVEDYRHALAENGYYIADHQLHSHVILTSLQRNMQALGAYGYLSLWKKKMRYLDFAEPGLALLADVLDKLKNSADPIVKMPVLHEIVVRASHTLGERIRSLKEKK